VGVASIRVLASTPVAGTTLQWQDLEKGVPLHVVVEHAVQRVPPGQTPVLAAFVNLTPEATHRGQQLVLEARVIATRPTQRGLDWVLTTEHVRQQRITVGIHIAFSSDSNPNSERGLRVSYDWAASITLEFPVADSSGAAPSRRWLSERRAPGNPRSEAHVSAPKTKPTEVSARSHVASIANDEQRSDAQTLLALMRRVTRQTPRMWGPSIVGFGSYHYKYPSGHEGDSALTGFAVRGSGLVVYIAAGFEGRDALLARLGKHKTGKVSVYLRRLADVDLRVLETLVARSVADTKSRYPQRGQVSHRV
jgi:hypothetical protein